MNAGNTTATEGVELDVAVIVAVAQNGVIGADGDIPWYYPEDLSHFKQTTTGHPVIMGRLTWESIEQRLGGPLPDRENIVLSRSSPPLPDGVHLAESIPEAVKTASRVGEGTAYVIGGESVYEAVLPVADRLIITKVPEAPDGDTEFPDWDRSAWEQVGRMPLGDTGAVVKRYTRQGD